MTTVPMLWPGATFVCLGTGPSLTQHDVDFVRSRARVIAVNDSYRLAPWADVLYACDVKWWRWQSQLHAKHIAAFAGFKYGMQDPSRYVAGVQVLKDCGEHGLEREPHGLRHGRNSGYAAINLAVHLGAAKIILLGYDMSMALKSQSHFFGQHPDQKRPLFRECIRNFKTIVEPLNRLHITVVNASRTTALDCFPRVSLERALECEVAA